AQSRRPRADPTRDRPRGPTLPCAPPHPRPGARRGAPPRPRTQTASGPALPRRRGTKLHDLAPAPVPTTIVVTPVRKEAWILDRFLRCASLWADHIVVADQGSTDGSRAIAARHSKVTLVDNTAPGYDEGARQRLLLDAARAFPGPRVIFALDAD